jgi:hypothetical protein
MSAELSSLTNSALAFGARGASFIPPGGTVVILSGLSGDVESESAYRELLQTWLEVLAAKGKARKIFVLCDEPESVAKESSPVTVLRADRTNFLALASRLQATTNALTVIAWGHGGKQGSEPVFHVRGPRITARDFKEFAEKVAAPDSRWILQFRGSGVFAGAVAGEKRQVLSSDFETAFTSDPVGMSVIGKIVRGKPEISFDELAEAFGRGTMAWYAERNLARTEEPTLWVGKDKPKLLAPASEENALASEKSETAAKPAKPGEKGSMPEPLPRDLPAVWQEIKRADAKNYPDADGIVLRRRISYTLGSNPAVASEQDEFIQILTAEGKRFGDFDVSFSPPHETITFLDTEVLSPDGKLARLDAEAIRETQNESVGDYQSGRRKFFSLPGVVPGAVVHVRYRTEWKTFPMPHVSLTIPIAVDLPAQEATIEVSVPKESAFHFAVEPGSLDDAGERPDPAIKQSGYATSYSWRFENLPAREHEVLSPPRSRSELLISTFPDWADFAGWYGRLSKLTDEVTPEIEARAKELTKEAGNDRDKVLALFNYVTRLRYVAIPMGVNSYRPHAAANVLKNQFGDCKDKANLLNALLHSLNIEGRLVLVPRFSQAREDIPGLSFNHAISRVTLGEDTLWVDTTDDVCRFGMLPPGDPGRKVLVIDGRTTNLTQMPVPSPKDHSLTLRGTLDCSNPQEHVTEILTATGHGYPDYELREAAREVGERRRSVPLFAARFRPVAGAFALEKQKWSAVSALDEDFSWEGEGEFVGAIAGTPLLLHCPFWLPREWDLALHRRRGALFLNQGYPLQLKQEFEFTLPANARPQALPAARENKTEPLRWNLQWSKVGDAKLAASLRIELAKGELSSAETVEFQKQQRALLSAMAEEVVLGK